MVAKTVSFVQMNFLNVGHRLGNQKKERGDESKAATRSG